MVKEISHIEYLLIYIQDAKERLAVVDVTTVMSTTDL